jgi:hypothetical protein
VREVVDRLLAAEKILVGEANWSAPYGDRRCLRWRKPCSILGEVTEMELEVIAYPEDGPDRFRIILVYQKAIWRLDYVRGEGHVNSLNRPLELPAGPIDEAHYHSWSDNRRFATALSLPNYLKNANVLPQNVRGFDTAFRWFCGQTNIKVASLDMPILPDRTTLL